MTDTDPKTQLTLETPFNRFVGAAIDDALWFAAAAYILGFLPVSVYDDHPEVVGILLIALASLWLNYFAFCESKWGQTVGKHVMGMRVLAADGSKASFGACSIRNVLRPFDYLIVGPVMIAATERHQRLGDKLGATIVVSERPDTVSGSPAIDPEDSTPLTDREHVRLAERTDTPMAPARPGLGPEAAASPVGQGGRLPEVGWSIGQTVGGVLGGLFLAALVAPVLVLPIDPDVLSGDPDAKVSLGATLVAQALLALALVGTALFVARRRGAGGGFDLRETLGELGWRRFHRKALVWVPVAFFAYLLLGGIYVVLFGAPKQEDIASDLGLDRGVVLASIAVFLICVVAPIAEETFFRGFVFAGLRRRFSLWPAALISGLVFGAVHAPSGASTVIPLAIFGIVLAALYERTGSIWPPVILHAINNVIAISSA